MPFCIFVFLSFCVFSCPLEDLGSHDSTGTYGSQQYGTRKFLNEENERMRGDSERKERDKRIWMIVAHRLILAEYDNTGYTGHIGNTYHSEKDKKNDIKTIGTTGSSIVKEIKEMRERKESEKDRERGNDDSSSDLAKTMFQLQEGTV